jgi:Fe-S cluster assembly iron-binding protein IscA
VRNPAQSALTAHVELPENFCRLLTQMFVLRFVAGLQLDYSDALIGGGFQFQNPNSCVPQRQEEAVEGGKRKRLWLTRGGVLAGGRRTDTCGCGKSFSA